MKQFTTPEQTAKLIELGFEKPKIVLLYAQSVDCDNNYGWKGEAKHNYGYTIGELIEMLPQRIGRWDLDIFHDYAFERWVICFNPEDHVGVAHELADVLYNLIVKLKEQGNI